MTCRWKKAGWLIADLFLFLTGVWCFFALRFCGGVNDCTGWGSAFVFAGIAAGGRIFFRGYRNLVFQLFLQLPLLIWFLCLEPSPDTVYQTPWKADADIRIHEPFVTVANVRDFHYRSENDYDVRYQQVTYDLREAAKLYLAVSHWDGLEKIAHTMLSFEFRDGKRVVLSVETRVPEGKSQGALPGLFKQFGLAMLWGTERDLLQLRTRFRQETLYLYPTAATPEDTAAIFLMLIRKTLETRRHPVFYNTLIRNCTTVLAEPFLPILLEDKVDFRLLFNGFVDELLWDAGWLHLTGGDLEESKNRYRIPASLPGGDAEYSRQIHRLLQ